MALEAKLKGTLKELETVWRWDTLCKLVRVDPYKRGMVSDSEIFIITHDDILRVFPGVSDR